MICGYSFDMHLACLRIKTHLSKFQDLIGFIQQFTNLAASYLAIERSSEGQKAEKGQEKENVNKECIVFGKVTPRE